MIGEAMSECITKKNISIWRRDNWKYLDLDLSSFSRGLGTPSPSDIKDIKVSILKRLIFLTSGWKPWTWSPTAWV